MKIAALINAPWAIAPDQLAVIQNVCQARALRDTLDISAIEARLGRPLANQRSPLQVVNGVAIVALDGILAKRMNMFMQISGGTSTQIAAAELQEALGNPEVDSIVLHIDSPGGTVDGTASLAQAVHEGRSRKRIVALADESMASAAYWIGAAAGPGNVFIASSTTAVGSIGVVAKHVDVSGAESRDGIKTTEISAGKYKRSASQYQALSVEGLSTIQDQVDYVYSLFVESVARNRGVSTATVLSRMADGRTFIGRQAVDAGLVDGMATLEQLIGRLVAARGSSTPAGAFALTSPSNAEKDSDMTTRVSYTKDEIHRLYSKSPEIAKRHGSFEAFMRSLDVEPRRPAAPPADPRVAQVAEAQRLAATEGIEFIDALKKLGYAR